MYWDVRDELITVIGDVALVRSTNKATRRRDGNEVTGMTTYTDTYLFENGAWKCIQAQITAVAPEHYPADDTIVSVYIKGKLQARGVNRNERARECTRNLPGVDGDRHAANVRLSHEDRHVQALLRPRHLRAGFAYRLGRGRRLLHGRAARLQEQPADHPAISCDQSEGAGAGAGDGPRHADRDAGDPRLHCAELSESQAGAR